MAVRVGINGFGRIGRNFFRAAKKAGADIDFVAVNDLGSLETMAHLLKYDSMLGVLPNEIKATKTGILVDGDELRVLSERDPKALPWGELGVDVVIESTGFFTKRADAAKHLEGGAKKVIISAPSGDADAMICMGVNDSVYDEKQHSVISNASCTTNCLAPMAKVLNDEFGIERGLMTTVHAYTSDQSLQDLSKPTRKGAPDLRRMRAAALSIIPSTTGAARAIGQVLPELKGRLDGTSLRVPTPTGSITDLTAELGKDASVDEINAAFQKAANEKSYKGVLEYSDEELVSADIVHNPASCIFSAPDTMASGSLIKVLGWYDNEWGYSNRLVDLVAFVG
jgi:glyceraldehyde 3-phosphate dehydrogenase